MNKPFIKEETKPLVGIFLIGIIMFISVVKTNNDNIRKQENIKAHRYETVAKVTKFVRPIETNTKYEYEYFYNEVKYKNSTDYDGGCGKLCEGKYYKIELSTEEPKYANIFLNMEITDTVKIRKAGL